MSILDRLRARLAPHEGLTIAGSGGIDSMVLAHVAHTGLPGARMAHAVSPAVPPAATERVRAHAAAAGWRLDLVDAGEFGDPRYRENPANRCYFCKLNLYSTVAALADGPVASGTNADDLGDFRPGLQAAEEYRVIHPYVDAGLGKAEIYALARELDLADLAALPAQPCLASRVETGIRIAAEDLDFVDRVEGALHARLGTGAVLRCRITHAGVIVELDESALDSPPGLAALAEARTLADDARRPFLGARAYRQGAAFLREAAQ